jgi:predicted HAD superfamily hydrolase/ubiquinone/menaquinone biosynthesis C-methylase UbiE
MKFTGERYQPEIQGAIKHEHLHRYAFCSEIIGGKDVLDIASGEGYGSYILSANAKSVLGVDISEEAINHSRATYQRDNLRFVQGTCTSIPCLDSSIDVVISFETIEHHNQHEEMMREIKRILKPCGLLIISSPNKKTFSDITGKHNEFHVKELYFDEFSSLLEKHFKYCNFYSQKMTVTSLIVNNEDELPSYYNALACENLKVSYEPARLQDPRFFIAVCTDTDNHSSILSNTSLFLNNDDIYYDLQNLLNNADDNVFITFYFDNGAGICDDCSTDNSIKLNNEIQKIIFSAPDIDKLSTIRIDPHCDSVILELESIYLVTSEGMVDLVSTGKMINNAVMVDGNRYYFETDDPQFIIENVDDYISGQIKEVVYKAKYIAIGKAALHECFKELYNRTHDKIKDHDKNAQPTVRYKSNDSEPLTDQQIHENIELATCTSEAPTAFHYSNLHLFSAVPPQGYQPGKIAIHLHLYYLDLADDLFSYFFRMPFRFDLIITITDDQQTSLIEQKAYLLCGSNLDNVFVIQVPNRGRDIAAFLVTLKDDYQRYDYICHVHSKKSLYSGSEKSAWCNYLFNSLFQNHLHIQKIFGLFQAQPHIGLIYPTTFDEMPYWCHSWLSNYHSSSDLFRRLGITFDTSQFIDYPVGSMFWARSDALSPLFKLKLAFEDFPSEPIPNDGTLCHAIERSFNIAAYLKGYTFAELDCRDENYIVGGGRKNLKQYWSRTIDELWNVLQSFQEVSFDIFDTLITRPLIMPDHAFLLVQHQIERNLTLSIDFLSLRKHAESLVRQNLSAGTDATIESIYKMFEQITGLSNQIVTSIKNLEIETEIRLSLPRKGMVTLVEQLQKSGKSVVFLSDMYLTSDVICNILEHCGFNCADIKILVSSETGIRKDSGAVWKHYLKYIAECHVGDNEHSDIQLALDMGIPHYHVMSPKRLFELAQPQMFPQYPMSLADSMYLGPVVARFFSSPFELHSTSGHLLIRNPKDLGYGVFGPVLLYFTTWLLAQCKSQGVRQLLFLAREGYLLLELFKLLTEKFGETGIESRYLLCSRRAISVPTIENEKDILALLEESYDGTLANLLESRYGISSTDLVGKVDIPAHVLYKERFVLPEQYTTVAHYVLQFKQAIHSQAQDEKNSYLKYLNSIAISHSENCAVVDIGFAGTIQKYLAKLTSINIGGFYLVTNQKALTNPCVSKIYGCFGNFVSSDEKNCIRDYSLTLEAVLTAYDGQLIRFKNGSPVYATSVHGEGTWPVIRAVQLGVIEYFKDMISWFGETIITSPPEVESATHFFKVISQYPQTISRAVREALNVDDFYVSNKVRNSFEYHQSYSLLPDFTSADTEYLASYFSGQITDEYELFRSYDEFIHHFDSNKFAYEERLLVEKILSNRSMANGELHYNGYCDCCAIKTTHASNWNASDAMLNHKAYMYNYKEYAKWYGKVILFREHLICQECHLNNRQRGVFYVIKKLGISLGKSSVYCYEQVTPFFALLEKKTLKLVGSEYLGQEYRPGGVYNGIRHEDAINLSFPDSSFDLLIANDVFEQVPNIEKTFSEAARVLKKGGILLFSIPFDISMDRTVQRAKLNNGQFNYLLEPVYHMNPVSEKGSLVIYDFGWDVLDFCKKNGFSDACMLYYYSTSHGLIGGGLQFVFVATK